MTQDNWCLDYPSCKASSDPHYSVSAPANSATIDSPSVFTYARIPTELQQWSPAVVPATENRGGSLTAPPGIAENIDHWAHASSQSAASNPMLPVALTSREYSAEAHSRPWRHVREAVTTHTHAPHAAWASLGLIRLKKSQVPSEPTDLDILGQSWSQCGDNRHAVEEALTQPTLPRYTLYAPHPVPDWSYMTALPEVGASSYAHLAGLGNVGPWVADPVPWLAPAHSIRRRHRRHSHARAEHVICDSCLKSMRRQSLKRHVREVHHHIKRPHPKSSSAAQPGP